MARIIEFYDGADSELTPVIGNIEAADLVEFVDDASYEAGNAGAPVGGNIYFNTTDNTVRYYDGSAWQEVGRAVDIQANASDIADIRTTTGTADGDTDMGSYTGALLTPSQSTKDNIQELSDAVEQNASDISDNASDISDNTLDVADTKTALGISDGDTDMGTYTGNIITDNTDQSAINQEISDAIESIPSGLSYQGNWDADTNTPTLTSSTGTAGHYYRVNVAGTTSLDGESDWEIGDWAVFTDTSVWQKVDNTSSVTSVNGQNGIVVLDTDDISEGTNEYFTNTRADARIAAASIDDLSDVDTSTVAPVDGETLVWDNAGSNWVPGAAGGSGQGGINYLEGDDTNFEEGTVGNWVQYNDGAVSEPVDGTGGTPSGNVTWLATNSDLLRGDWLGNFNAIATNNQGEGISVDFTIDKADWNKSLYLSYDVYTAGNWTADHVLPFIYDVDAATLVPLSRSGTSDRFTGRFSTNGTSLNYRLILHIVSSDVRNFTYAIDNVQVGPDKIVDSPVVGYQGSYDASPAGWTGATHTGNYWRADDRMIVEIVSKFTSASAAIGNLYYPLPPGHTIDASKLNSPDSLSGVCGVSNYYNFATGVYTGDVTYRDTTHVQARVNQVAAHAGIVPVNTLPASNTFPFTFNNTDSISVRFEVPILEWANSTAVLSTTEMLNLVPKAARYSAGGQSIPTAVFTPVDFEVGLFLEGVEWIPGAGYNSSLGTWTTNPEFVIKKYGKYRVSSFLGISSLALNSNQVLCSIYKNGGEYWRLDQSGVGASSIQSTGGTATLELDVGDTIQIRAYQDQGVNRPLINYSPANGVSIEEIPDLSVYSVYGETDTVEIQAQPFSFPNFTGGVAQVITSFTFPSTGEWDVTVDMGTRIHSVGHVGAFEYSTKLDTSNSVNIATGDPQQFGKNSAAIVFDNAVTYTQSNSSFTKKFEVTDTSQTYYLRHNSNSNTATNDLRLDYYSIFARKVK